MPSLPKMPRFQKTCRRLKLGLVNLVTNLNATYELKMNMMIPRNLQQDLLNGPLNLSIWVSNNSSNLLFRGPLGFGPIQFLMEWSFPSHKINCPFSVVLIFLVRIRRSFQARIYSFKFARLFGRKSWNSRNTNGLEAMNHWKLFGSNDLMCSQIPTPVLFVGFCLVSRDGWGKTTKMVWLVEKYANQSFKKQKNHFPTKHLLSARRLGDFFKI